jgi:hypothetical protein
LERSTGCPVLSGVRLERSTGGPLAWAVTGRQVTWQ